MDAIVGAEMPSGEAWGDPHLTTFDGLGYDLQSVGEFQAITSDDDSLELQVRYSAPPVGVGTVSVLTAVAFRLGDHFIALEAGGDVSFDGDLVSLPDGYGLTTGDGGAVIRLTDGVVRRWIIVWPGTGERPVMTLRQVGASTVFQNAAIYIPDAMFGKLSGFYGDADGSPENDLRTADGMQLPFPATPELVHGPFAGSWRLQPEDSLFYYGVGESTETFTDLTYPTNVVSLSDFGSEDQAVAAEGCRANGMADGLRLSACMLDLLVTEDSSLAFSTAGTEPAHLGADGSFIETFETSSALDPSQVYTDVAGRRWGGPFSNGSAVLSLDDLPPHLAATVELDLAVVGDWDGDGTSGGPDDWSLGVNGNVAESFTFSNTSATQSFPEANSPSQENSLEIDTLTAGDASAVYRITAEVPHTASSLDLELSGSPGVSALTGERWYVDNIRVQVQVVPPQTFSISLSEQVEDGSPATGAGRLETRVAQDRYEFTVGSPTEVLVQMSSCASLLFGWSLDSSDNGHIADSPMCQSRRVHLSAGDHVLTVWTSFSASGTYKTAVIPVPSPDTFSVALGDTVSNGSPGSGAGNLETPVSEDHYNVTLAQAGRLVVDMISCSGATIGPRWTVVNGTGAAVANGLACTDGEVDLPAGNFTIIVAPFDERNYGTYSFRPYLKPPAQVFGIVLGAQVSNGVPAAGAGNLETGTSEDRYEFSLTNPTEIMIEFSNCSTSLGPSWEVLDAFGAVRLSEDICNDNRGTLPAGDYTISVQPFSPSYPGTYKMKAYEVPAPQSFNISLGTQVSNGVPSAGAGNHETGASQDRYEFTVANAGQVFIDMSNCITFGPTWTVLDSTGTPIGSEDLCADGRVFVTGGQYTLVVDPYNSSNYGTYRVKPQFVPPPDVFNVTLGNQVSNGVPGIGAGNHETGLSEDHYIFTLGTAATVKVDLSDCSPILGANWKIVDGSGTQLAGANLCSDAQVALSAGTYTIVVTPYNTTYFGTYKLLPTVVP